MHGPASHRPSPALVIAIVALFVWLGGTGYAASTIAGGQAAIHRRKDARSPDQAPGQRSDRWIFHRTSGPSGGAGRCEGRGRHRRSPWGTGATGTPGTPGPGAIPILASVTSANTEPQPAGAAAPWFLALTCKGSGATFSIHGPGTVGGTTSLAAGGGAATTYIGDRGPIGSGADSAVNSGSQMSQTEFLRSGSTLYEVNMMLTAVNGGLFDTCNLVGDAIPVS